MVNYNQKYGGGYEVELDSFEVIYSALGQIISSLVRSGCLSYSLEHHIYVALVESGCV